MRGTLLPAGRSAAAIASLLAGAGLIWAQPLALPRQAVTIAPDAASLAANVTAPELVELVLDRLHAFNARPLRGGRDVNGKDRLRAWRWTPMARTAVELYRQTHDDRLILALLDSIDAYRAALENTDGVPGWYTDDATTRTRYREVCVTGLILAPMVDLLLAASTDQRLAGLIGSRQTGLLAQLTSVARGLQDRYLDDQGHGYYRLPYAQSDQDVEPLNLASVYGEPLLGLWRLTGDADLLRQVTGLARTWKAELAGGPGKPVTWPYLPRPAPANLLEGPRERLVKAAAGIGFPLAAYRAGLVLDRADAAKIAHAPAGTILVRIDDRHYLIRSHLDPGSQSFLDPHLDRAPRPGVPKPDNPLALASWYAYGCLDDRLAGELDPILFGINRRFYQLHNGALLGLAHRLTITRDPEACRVADDGEQAAGPIPGSAG